ncbi:alpha-L-rhamnosidase C-terminal domain-containing protein, partial [Streptomyces sp. NPDC059863]
MAYRELLLRPLPGGRLTWARAEQETARGRAECGWALADGRLTITATVPPSPSRSTHLGPRRRTGRQRSRGHPAGSARGRAARACLQSSAVRPQGGPGGVRCVRSQGGGSPQ